MSSDKLFFFPEEIIELNREIARPEHTALQLALGDMGGADWLVKLLRIATWCKIGVDGEYSQEDLMRVAEACRKRLVESRTLVIVSR